MITSPLFRHAAKTLTGAAHAEFRRSTFGRMVDEAEQALKTGGAPQRLEKVVQKYAKRFKTGGFIRNALPGEVGQLVGQIQRYAKGKGAGGLGAVFGEFLTALGPVGNMIKALASKPSRKADIQAATELLQKAGYTVTPAKGAPYEAFGVEAVLGYLEQLGFQIVPPGAAPKEPEAKGALPFGISRTLASGEPRKSVDVPGGFGVASSRFRVDHPAVTGEEVRPRSANVYGYQYDMEAAILYVRFKVRTGEQGRGTGAGSLYAYYDVTPIEFRKFHQRAKGSAGEAVWDYLRRRGSAVEHQKDYRLVGIMPAFVSGQLFEAYVPRKATYVGAKPMWQRRKQVYLGRGRWTQSQLPSEEVAAWATRGEPNRGEPNRG